jgi:hypothetical protein
VGLGAAASSASAALRQLSTEAPSKQREQVPVVRIANAIVQLDKAFDKRAALCLGGVGDIDWSPAVEGAPACALQLNWKDVPVFGGFRVDRIGTREIKRYPSSDEKAQQLREYETYLQWVEGACGVAEGEAAAHFVQILRTATELERTQRGVRGIPVAFRMRRPTVRTHALLLCRVESLRKSVALMSLPELGGDAFSARATQELERIMALTEPEAAEECNRIRSEMRSSQSFNLPTASLTSSAFVPGLFRFWLHREGARLMGATIAWDELVREGASSVLDAPSIFSLDDAQADLGIPDGQESNKLRRGEVPLRGAWWRFTWNATRSELRQRYGESRMVRLDGAASDSSSDVKWTVEEMYVCMRCKPQDPAKLRVRESQLLNLYRSLKSWEEHRKRPIKSETIGRFTRHSLKKAESIFDAKTVATLWSHIAQLLDEVSEEEPWPAWEWASPFGASSLADAVPDDKLQISSIPRKQIEDIGDGVYKWKAFRVEANNADEGFLLLNAAWHDQQHRHAHAKHL